MRFGLHLISILAAACFAATEAHDCKAYGSTVRGCLRGLETVNKPVLERHLLFGFGSPSVAVVNPTDQSVMDSDSLVVDVEYDAKTLLPFLGFLLGFKRIELLVDDQVVDTQSVGGWFASNSGSVNFVMDMTEYTGDSYALQSRARKLLWGSTLSEIVTVFAYIPFTIEDTDALVLISESGCIHIGSPSDALSDDQSVFAQLIGSTSEPVTIDDDDVCVMEYDPDDNSTLVFHGLGCEEINPLLDMYPWLKEVNASDTLSSGTQCPPSPQSLLSTVGEGQRMVESDPQDTKIDICAQTLVDILLPYSEYNCWYGF